MDLILYQLFLPFILSAIIVVIIMAIAEKYGTKIGGILGTLPSTIVIALFFLAINKDINFASKSASVIPAELGINILFLVIFAILVFRSVIIAFFISLSVWIILTYSIIIINLNNIWISIIIYIISLFLAFIILENKKKIKSIKNVEYHYNKKKIILRGLIAGIVISIAILLSNIGAIISGIFSVFPAIIISTMLISYKEYGPNFSAGIAKSMIFGISSVAVYATSVHFLYPIYDIFFGSFFSYLSSITITIILLIIKDKIQ
jgi:hypothetical protein